VIMRFGTAAAFVALGLVLLAVASGCAGESWPKTYLVNGKVVVKNGDVSTLAGGQVFLESVTEPKVTGAGEIEEDGTFSVGCNIDGKDRAGIPAGEYRVCLKPPTDDEESPKRTGALQPRYRTYDKSGLKTTVTEGSNSPTIEVEASR
jgi:hypothetical protein